MSDVTEDTHSTEPAVPAASTTTTRSASSTASTDAAALLGPLAAMPRQQLVGMIVGGLRSVLERKTPAYLPRPVPTPATELGRRAQDADTATVTGPTAARPSRRKAASE